MKEKNIRNFAIISHIDHGKSTLSDRLMEMMGTVNKREIEPQLLDSLTVEQKHGVTVKARTVQNIYTSENGEHYQLNLIDTPGHVDFNYEVSKSLAATDGVILLVDATQGVQAQTVANWRLAHELGLPMLPVINKVDSPNADIEAVKEELLHLDSSLAQRPFYEVSAKTGQGVAELIKGIIHYLPAPKGDEEAPLKALVYDSEYDPYLGVIIQVRIFNGQLVKNSELKLMASGRTFKAKDVGIYQPSRASRNELSTGEVGYVITGVKEADDVRVGDTVTTAVAGVSQALPGFEKQQPMVYAGFFPQDNYQLLKEALQKIALNDSALLITDENSTAMGPGFRIGFLGIFHLKIIQERLEEEYGLKVTVTSPNVPYEVKLKDASTVKLLTNPAYFPSFEKIESIAEPMMIAVIDCPSESLDRIMQLAEQYRGIFQDMDNEGNRVQLVYRLPLAEIAYDFYNQLKSISHGYASLQTKPDGYEVSDLVKVEVQINYAKIDALSFITHRSNVEGMTQKLVHELKMTVPRRLYPMPVQAVVEGKVLARVDVPPLRKNAAVNGEQRSISKKQALLRRQNVNKRTAAHSDIELPQAVFNTLLALKD